MTVSAAHSRASSKWNASRDNIMLRPSKEVGAAIRAAAAEEGLTVQSFVLKAVTEYMERKNEPFSMH